MENTKLNDYILEIIKENKKLKRKLHKSKRMAEYYWEELKKEEEKNKIDINEKKEKIKILTDLSMTMHKQLSKNG